MEHFRIVHLAEVARQIKESKDEDDTDVCESETECSGGYKVPSEMWRKLYRFVT